MGASMKAAVLPGRAISWDGASATGCTTLTMGMAASCVARETLASAFTRERMPKKMTRATTATALAGIHQEMRFCAEGGEAAAGWAAATATVAGLGDCVAGVSAFAASSCVLDSAFIGDISPGSLCVHFVQLCFLRKFCSRIAFRMQETENGGNENQGGHRCEEQAADYGA